MNRHRTVAARAARDSRGCPACRAALAALARAAHRRTAGADAAAPVPALGVAAGVVAGPDGPPPPVTTVAVGEPAAFSVESSRAAWPAAPPVPVLPVPLPPVLPPPVPAPPVPAPP